MKIVGKGSLGETTVVAVCCLALIVVELASAAENPINSLASRGNQEDHEDLLPSINGNLNSTTKHHIASSSEDSSTPYTSLLLQDKQSNDGQKATIEIQAEQSVKYAAIITTYRPKTAAVSLLTANRQQDLIKEHSTETHANPQDRTVQSSATVTTVRPKIASGTLQEKDHALKQQGSGISGTSEPTLKAPTAERRQDRRCADTDTYDNNLNSVKEVSEFQSKTLMKTSSLIHNDATDEEAHTDADGNRLDKIAQSSAIISAFDTVGKGWMPISAPWRSLPQKAWLNGQQALPASANNQYQFSASVTGYNSPYQSTSGIWAATNSQQQTPIQAVFFMKKVPVPYPVTIEKQVPVRIEVPVHKPYPVYIPRPYHLYMEKKIPYRVPEPGPAQYTFEKRIPVPVTVPVQKPYPVHVPASYPVYVMKRVPYTVSKDVHLPMEMPVEKHVPYPVEKVVPVPVQVQVKKPVPVLVERKVPVFIERRVPVYIHRLVPYPMKIQIRMPVPVPYYNNLPSNSNHQINYLRSSSSYNRMQEQMGSQSSVHQVIVFPKKPPHTNEQEQIGDHYEHQANQQHDPDEPASTNYDENEDEENDSGDQGRMKDTYDRNQQSYDEHYPEENGYNYETDDDDYEKTRGYELYNFRGSTDPNDSYNEDDDYGEEKKERYLH